MRIRIGLAGIIAVAAFLASASAAEKMLLDTAARHATVEIAYAEGRS